jgi:hypothetical protein
VNDATEVMRFVDEEYVGWNDMLPLLEIFPKAS